MNYFDILMWQLLGNIGQQFISSSGHAAYFTNLCLEDERFWDE